MVKWERFAVRFKIPPREVLPYVKTSLQFIRNGTPYKAMKTLGRVWVITVMIVAMIASDSTGLSHNDTATEMVSSEAADHHQRSKRSLMFPYNAAQGIIVAIALPLGIPDRNIFLSYNFEGNYNNPIQSNIFTEGFFNFIIGDLGIPLQSPAIFINRALNGDSEVVETPTTTEQIEGETAPPTQSDRHPEDLLNAFANRSPNFTRKKAYRAIERHLKRTGLDGKKCLLRAICEAAETPLLEHNGIIGDVMHILLSPSSSADEGLPPEFYKAEELGEQGQCQKYRKRCDKNVLDEISFMM
ncbi:uncharacterized protein LOC115260799 [Aedes albopictus]|uniref:Uncharacterized protein n=1 Tax=Aedes albopictus TaxID=7160 RepID=A0ABM1Y4M1_AEDAL